MKENTTTTICRLERGAFRVTAQFLPLEGSQGFFDITVTDQDVEVTATFSALRFKSKARLSVQDLGMGFWCMLHQAWLARLEFTDYCAEIFPGSIAQNHTNVYKSFRDMREKIIAMDIAGDDIPAVMREVAIKYDLEVTEHG